MLSNMKTLLSTILALGLGPAGSMAAEPPHPSPTSRCAPIAWLGIQVAKPDPSITAHLPTLPLGIGFLVTSSDPAGPAQAAGVAALDIISKLNDQWLVNESQLAALLRLQSPGDSVQLAGFRHGKPIEFTVTLGTAPAQKSPDLARLIDASILPAPELSVPMRIVHVNEKVASYSTEEGHLQVAKTPQGYHIRITGPDGNDIYQGNMAEDGSLSGLADHWTRRVLALRRGLDHQLASQASSMASNSPQLPPDSRQISAVPQPSER